ncbi:MAG: NAD-dependent protein deacylase [Candidatus Thorarchaeota archaeon SMTZ1-45]|nr:MAG: NAD-dependent deacylase [Candidatus Thorarchaeota archaeon SMTZ1-45]
MLKEAADIIMNSEYFIALTGAGVSKESNIPTFRGEDGLWRNYDAMELATPSAFARNPSLVWEWYAWRQGLIGNCEPNPAHKTLSSWENRGILKTLITQNVDGLHIRAGSVNVLEVHGDLWALKCTSCDYRERLSSPVSGIPTCPKCNSHLRPDVVWFGESLNPQIMRKVYSELELADVCIVIGTSALVQPAASFPLIVRQHGGRIIEINIEKTIISSVVDVHISGKAGEILPALNELLQ